MKRFALCFAILPFLFAPAQTQERQATLRLVSAEQHKRFLYWLFPKSDDPWLAEIKARGITFYTENQMPKAYQHGGGVHSPSYNISGGFRRIGDPRSGREPFGNANIEFPWGKAGGVDLSPGANEVRWVSLPENGVIRWWRERSPSRVVNAGNVIRWAYPAGTVFGEILTCLDDQENCQTFEMRVRLKTESGTWHSYVYRPFGSPEELNNRIKAIEPNWKDDPQIVAFLNHDHTAGPIVKRQNRQPDRVIFRRTALADPLPSLPAPLVKKLLKDTPYKVVTNAWVKTERGDCWAPTVDRGFNVVPPKYSGHFFTLSSKKCMACHETVGMSVDAFESNRDWYGHVRGSDAIFSFHIFDPASISHNGMSFAPRFRKELLQAGLLQAKGAPVQRRPFITETRSQLPLLKE